MKKTTIIKILITSLLLMIAGTGYAMSRFNLCLFSEVEGIVLEHGKPVVGAELERIWGLGYDQSKGSDSTITDKKGYFKLPTIKKFKILPGILPFMQPVIAQDIFIYHKGEKIKAWRSTKWDYQLNSELNKPIRLICHVEKDPEYTEIPDKGGDTVFGVCEIVDQL
jgi:hypothetical protein